MESKKCFKCGLVKPITEFYKHSEMADGHLNKCKDCTKKDVNKNRSDKIDYYREYDRERYYKNGYRYKDGNIPKVPIEKSREYTRTYRANNPGKYVAHTKLRKALERGEIIKPKICSICGKECRVEGHHSDYTKPLSVIWICHKCHAKIHREINKIERDINNMVKDEA